MVGEKLGSFTLESTLGSGAMGQVYLATHDKSGRKAAVKVIALEHVGKGTTDNRFEREAEILQQFRHPNIVRFYAVGKSKGRPYIAMEFVGGGTLDSRLETQNELPWQEVVELGIQICEALQYAHTHGVIHRDLKPSNLMIADDGAVKLTDFGIAKDLDATALTATGRTLGTAAYMAPEQIRGNPAVSHKTDLYSLGCVLFQLLTGSLPFKGGSAVALMHQHLSEPPPRPSTRNPQIPKALDNLILHLLAKSPTDRPWDAAAVAHKLTELRAKVDRGETVAMVFDTGGAGGNARSSMPLDSTQPATGGGGIVVTDGLSLTGSVLGSGLRKTTKKKKKSKGKSSGRSISNVSIWGTAGLVVGLIGVVALIAWQLMPPTAEKLFREAEKLMASSELSSWNQAEREFLGELDRRYPNHPYQAQVRDWRDRSLLEQTRRRAEILEKSAIPSLREPKTEAEGLFVQVALAAREAVETRHEDTATTMWQQMADQLKAESGHEPRGWLLYAQQRVDEQTQIVARRRREAQTLLDQADSEEAVANHDLARRLRERMLDQYEKYPYLSDLVRQARLGLPASVAPDPTANDPRAPADPSPDP